jgi:uncharacterized membrane protein YcaP (DUF421 family)
MEQEQTIELFDLQRLLMGKEIPYSFLMEVLLRSVIMFFVVLLVLRLSGKRGIKQLSIFELAILISLGSATGDPMFYQEVGLLPAILVFLVVIAMYKLITHLTGKYKKVEEIIEGKPVKLIEDGKIIYETFKKESFAYDELFLQLRQDHVTHLGQVESAYLETSGDLSIFFFPNERVRAGLPILPDVYDFPCEEIHAGYSYACKHCGEIKPDNSVSEQCKICGEHEWLETAEEVRQT